MNAFNKRELAILDVLLSRAPEAVYGQDVAKYVYSRWLYWLIGSSQIYVHLFRLENRGLIEHIREQVEPGYPGLPRYLYRLSDAGRRLHRALSGTTDNGHGFAVPRPTPT